MVAKVGSRQTGREDDGGRRGTARRPAATSPSTVPAATTTGAPSAALHRPATDRSRTHRNPRRDEKHGRRLRQSIRQRRPAGRRPAGRPVRRRGQRDGQEEAAWLLVLRQTRAVDESNPFQGFEPVPPEQVQEDLSYDEALAAATKLAPSPGRYYVKLKGLYGGIGIGLFPFDQTCSSAILRNAEQTARALDTLARENRAVARIIEFMLSTSTIGLFLGAHAEILYTIFQHHASLSMKAWIPSLFAMWQTPEEEEVTVGDVAGNGGPVD